MEERENKSVIWYVLLGVLILALLIFGATRHMAAENLENDIKMDYQRCFTEVVQYEDDIQLNLEKSKFVNDPRQMLRLSGEIYRQASAASANLALLPLRSEPLEHLCEFLNQVGNFAYSLSFKMLDGHNITDEEYENLKNLGDYAKSIAASLDGDLEDLYNGTLDIKKAAEGSEVEGIDKVMGEIENQLHDYPALIYDGPFSSHLTDREPEFLKGKENISEEEARGVVEKITGRDNFECVLEKGNLPVYYFYDEEGLCTLAVTVQGGYVISYLNDIATGESNYDIVDAKITALNFLESNGFHDMKESYYETISNVAVINYAATDSGYTLYPDLVKVKVALDTNTVVGFESRGYLMNHVKREIPDIKVSVGEAKEKVNPHVNILSATLSLIPTEGGGEAFCWQIEGKVDDRRCLIYVNTQTGAEEKLFILIESDSGVLAV